MSSLITTTPKRRRLHSPAFGLVSDTVPPIPLGDQGIDTQETENQEEVENQETPAGNSFSSELRYVACELQQALEEAESEAEWHRQALQRAEARANSLREHLAPLAEMTETLMPANGSLAEMDALARIGPQRETSLVAVSSRPTSSIEMEELCPARDAQLRIYCLGSFRVWDNGRFVESWPSLRGQAILRFLAAHRQSPVSRDVLMETFWPSVDAEAARRNLHQAVYSLRLAFRREPCTADKSVSEKDKSCGTAPVLFENGHYCLNPAFKVWMDWEEFEDRIKNGRRLKAAGSRVEAALEFSFALELYRGDFLEEATFEDWVAPRRTSLRNLFLEAAGWLSSYFFEQKEYSAALAVCERMLQLDPCNEQGHFRLMECYAQQGQRSAAIRQYHLCRQALRDELGVSPSTEMQALFQELIRESEAPAKAKAAAGNGCA